MTQARVVWPPYPYDAGFCITDDPDASTLKQTRAVYDFLLSRAFVTTKAVWAFDPTERCGIPAIPDSALRGITLCDKDYFLYCKELQRHGCEICLHGASAGNNIRKRTEDAFYLLRNDFGTSDTFICHAKNADNIYWEDKVTTRMPFHNVLGLYSKHSCAGEMQDSPYFWGDLCRANINQIRLYRTRRCNTLERNPSMPYYDPHKPFVNGWFSATKRSLAACATATALDQLKREHGITILYQYLHKYVDADTGRLNAQFIAAIDRIRSDSRIIILTVSNSMKRLRQIQGVFIVYRRNDFWIINVCGEDIENLQIVTQRPLSIREKNDNLINSGFVLVVKKLLKDSIQFVPVSDQIVFTQKRAMKMPVDENPKFTLMLGELIVNLAGNERQFDGKTVSSKSFYLSIQRSGTGLPLLSVMPRREEIGLICDQMRIIGGEVLFKGRSLNIEKYLDDSREIPLDNQESW